MKEKVIELIEKRIDYLENVILESLPDIYDSRSRLEFSIKKPKKIEKNMKKIKANTQIVELCTTKILELKSLLNEIENLNE